MLVLKLIKENFEKLYNNILMIYDKPFRTNYLIELMMLIHSIILKIKKSQIEMQEFPI